MKVLKNSYGIILSKNGNKCAFIFFFSFITFDYNFKGWSMLSVGASRLASKATESALKFGEIASQKVVQVTETVGEKVS